MSLPVASGLVLHLDASTIQGLNNWDRVATWNDLSGNNFHATQSDNDLRPYYRTDILNGLPTVQFNGHYMTVGQPAALNFSPQSDQFTIIHVARVTTGNYGVVISRALSGSDQYSTFISANEFHTRVGHTTRNAGSITGDDGRIAGVINYLDNSTMRFRALVDDGWSDQSNSGSTTVSDIDTLIGGRRETDNTDSHFRLFGFVGEILVYDRALSQSELTSVRNYLGVKWLDWEEDDDDKDDSDTITISLAENLGDRTITSSDTLGVGITDSALKSSLPITDGLVLHLDASQLTGFNHLDDISTWEDLSGNDLHATQTDTNRQPSYHTNIHDKPVVLFSDQWMTFGQPEALNFNPRSHEYTIIHVTLSTASNAGTIFSRATAANNQYRTLVGDGDLMVYVGGIYTNAGNISDGNWRMSGVINYNDNGTWRFRTMLDGELSSATNSGTTTVSNIDTLIGARRETSNTNTGYRLWAYVGELIVYNRVLTTEEREAIQQYFGEKWLGWEIITDSDVLNISTVEVDSDRNLNQPETLVIDATENVDLVIPPDVPIMGELITEGLVLRLDASELTDIDDNDPIDIWPDLSGEDNHAIANVSATPEAGELPVYREDVINELPVVRFTAENEHVLTSTFSDDKQSIFIVANYGDGAKIYHILDDTLYVDQGIVDNMERWVWPSSHIYRTDTDEFDVGRGTHKAIFFDGENDYIQLSQAIGQTATYGGNDTDSTVEVGFTMQAPPSWAAILGNVGIRVYLAHTDTNIMRVMLRDIDNNVNLFPTSGTTTVTLNEMAHVSSVLVGRSHHDIYINSDITDRFEHDSIGLRTVANEYAYVGRFRHPDYPPPDPGYYYYSRCHVHYIKVWTKALDDIAIATGIGRRLTGTEDNLLAYFPLDEGTGTTVSDLSPNAYSGTIVGATWEDYTRHFSGDIGEVLVYDRVLSESERKQTVQYLGEKWLDWTPITTQTGYMVIRRVNQGSWIQYAFVEMDVEDLEIPLTIEGFLDLINERVIIREIP